LSGQLPWSNPKKGVVLLKNACSLGYGEGCNDLGVAYAQGTGTAQDLAEAARQFERACDLGSMNGCSNLGVAALEGEGTARDKKRAAALFARACKAGHQPSCEHADDLR
jgi:TPR repeat protein